MKKHIYFSIFAGLILFVWQFLSHAALNFHEKGQQYTDKQDTLIASLISSGIQEGTYMVPMPKPGSTPEQYEAYAKEQQGKPWAKIVYHESNENDMLMCMLRGFAVDIIIALFFYIALSHMNTSNYSKGMTYGIVIGLITFLYQPYTEFIWYKSHDIYASLLDGIIPWAVIGALAIRFKK
jgi:hypothetical protein